MTRACLRIKTRQSFGDSGREAGIQAEIDALIEAARMLVAEGGLRGLSLRAVSAASGWTLGEIAYRVGKKEDLVARLVEAEREKEARLQATWRSRLSHVKKFADAELEAVVAAYLDDVAARHHSATMLWDALLLEACLDPAVSSFMTPWIAERAAFWQTLLAGRHADADTMARAITAYVAGEQLYTVVLGADPEYRLVRHACIHRLCGAILKSETAGSVMLFDSILDQHRPRPVQSAGMSARARGVAEAASRLMLEKGVAAITHRSVAAELGQTPSAVLHHFRTPAELVRAGIEALYLRVSSGLDTVAVRQQRSQPTANADPQQTGVQLLYASYLITLAAARDTSFTGLAKDRRMERGRMPAPWMADLFPDPTRFDRCAAQTVSIALGGAFITSLAQGEPYAGHPPAVLSDLIALASADNA